MKPCSGLESGGDCYAPRLIFMVRVVVDVVGIHRFWAVQGTTSADFPVVIIVQLGMVKIDFSDKLGINFYGVDTPEEASAFLPVPILGKPVWVLEAHAEGLIRFEDEELVTIVGRVVSSGSASSEPGLNQVAGEGGRLASTGVDILFFIFHDSGALDVVVWMGLFGVLGFTESRGNTSFRWLGQKEALFGCKLAKGSAGWWFCVGGSR